MKLKRLGNSDLFVSPIILGTWALGGSNWGNYDHKAAYATIEKAIELGINTIDTAPAYNKGNAEAVIGKIIKNRREHVIIATKCGLNFNKASHHDLSPEFIREDLQYSLARLKTDYIDLYQCHWPDKDTPLEHTMETLATLQESGKIKYIGLSNYDAAGIKTAMQYADIVSLQSQYSLLNRDIEHELVPLCTDSNMGIISYGSLGGGLLSGKYTEQPKFKNSDARSFFYPFFKPEYWPQTRHLIDKIRETAQELDVRPANIALAWNLAQPGITAAIVGAKTAEQIAINALSADIHLKQAHIEQLNILSDQLQ